MVLRGRGRRGRSGGRERDGTAGLNVRVDMAGAVHIVPAALWDGVAPGDREEVREREERSGEMGEERGGGLGLGNRIAKDVKNGAVTIPNCTVELRAGVWRVVRLSER